MATLEAALDYARLGWRVVPILAGSKRPALTRWTEHASTDEATIKGWWDGHDDYGVGIATGPSSGFWALDVDDFDSLRDLEQRYEVLPDTRTSITGSGGYHFLFRWPDDGRDIRNDAGRRLGPGLDIRGDGGQIVAPPTIHPNDTAYQWDAGTGDDVADAPAWLLDLVSAVDYLRRGLRPDFTVWDALAEAIRWWNEEQLATQDSALDERDRQLSETRAQLSELEHVLTMVQGRSLDLTQELSQAQERHQQEAQLAARRQQELAERVGMRQPSLNYLEDPKKNAQGSEFTVRIARACGVDVDWLSEGEGEMLPLVYSTRDMQELFEGLPVKFIERTIIFGAYDNIIARFGALGKFLRAILQFLEATPLKWFGLSHFWVVEKI